MTTFSIDTSQLWRTSAFYVETGELVTRVASILRSAADNAGVTGDQTSATALANFLIQWTDELAREADGSLARGHNMQAAAAVYDATESLSAQAFTNGS